MVIHLPREIAIIASKLEDLVRDERDNISTLQEVLTYLKVPNTSDFLMWSTRYGRLKMQRRRCCDLLCILHLEKSKRMSDGRWTLCRTCGDHSMEVTGDMVVQCRGCRSDI